MEATSMPIQDPTGKYSTTRQPNLDRPTESVQTPGSEEVFVRSYDHRLAYDIDIEVRTLDGEVVFEDRYYLLPGHTEIEKNAIPAGEMQVVVSLDNEVEKSTRCKIGDGPEHTVMIEVGNGALSVTEGLHPSY